jgi:hypothetical protein
VVPDLFKKIAVLADTKRTASSQLAVRIDLLRLPD